MPLITAPLPGDNPQYDYILTIRSLLDALSESSVILDFKLEAGGLSEEEQNNAIADQQKIESEILLLENEKNSWIGGNRNVHAPSVAQVKRAVDLATSLAEVNMAEMKTATLLDAVADALNIATSLHA